MIPTNEGDERCYGCEHFYESYGCIPTYNGDKCEWYFDAYKKFENMCIPD